MAGASQVTSTESSPFNTCCTLRGALVSRIKEITSDTVSEYLLINDLILDIFHDAKDEIFQLVTQACSEKNKFRVLQVVFRVQQSNL